MIEAPILNVPNILSVLRIALVPVIVLSFYCPWEWANWVTASIFLLSGFTDCLDGLLARKLDQMTRFGEFIDPVADKLMVSISLILLVESFHSVWLTIPAILIIGRELVVSALREWMGLLGNKNRLKVNFMGKIKTAMQIISIGLLFISGSDLSSACAFVGLVALYVAGILAVLSMCMYFFQVRKFLNTAM